VLKPAGFVTFMRDGVAARLHDTAFTDSLNNWLAVLGPAGFVTFMNTICNGKYVHKNPKLFLSELGSKVERPLNLIPDILV
jgi:hypothetical protein